MLILIKVISLFPLIVFTLYPSDPGLVTFILAGCILLAIAFPLRIIPTDFVKRNLFILSFVFIFSSFAALSGYLIGDIDYREIALTSVKIILIYNTIYIGGYWLGKNGFLSIVDTVPCFRVKLYLLLMYNILSSFIKRNQLIMHQLKSRLDLSHQRGLIARYYVQNLIVKELYSIHLNQAAIVTRLHSDFDLYVPSEKLKIHDVIVLTLIALLILGNLYLRV